MAISDLSYEERQRRARRAFVEALEAKISRAEARLAALKALDTSGFLPEDVRDVQDDIALWTGEVSRLQDERRRRA